MSHTDHTDGQSGCVLAQGESVTCGSACELVPLRLRIILPKNQGAGISLAGKLCADD